MARSRANDQALPLLRNMAVLKMFEHASNSLRWFVENADDVRWAERAFDEIKPVRRNYFLNTRRSVEEGNDQLMQGIESLFKYVTASEEGRDVSKRDLRMANKIMDELVSIHEFVEKYAE